MGFPAMRTSPAVCFAPSGDDDGIDVGEDSRPASFAGHRRHDGAAADIYDHGELVEHHDAVAGALLGGAGDGGIEALEASGVQVEVAAVDAFLRVAAELDVSPGSGEKVGECRCPGCAGRSLCTTGGGAGERGVVFDSHR
jgi:hypothetical protein